MAQARRGDRQGHPDLQLHVRGGAGSRPGRRRRGRAADGADADPRGGPSHAFDARRWRHRDLRLAQPAPRQRHQVLLGAGREARRRDGTGDRGRAGRAVPHRAFGAVGPGGAHPGHHRPLRRSLQEFGAEGLQPRRHADRGRLREWRDLPARPAGAARTRRAGGGDRGRTERPQHQRRRRFHPSGIAGGARARERCRPRHRLRRRRRPRVVRRREWRGARRRRPVVRAGLRLAAERSPARAGDRHPDDQLRLRARIGRPRHRLRPRQGRRSLRAPATAGQRCGARRRGVGPYPVPGPCQHR